MTAPRSFPAAVPGPEPRTVMIHLAPGVTAVLSFVSAKALRDQLAGELARLEKLYQGRQESLL